MVIFSWKKELETGIELIDQQHMQILIAVNKLLICRKCHTDAERIRDCLRFLEDYIQYHFQAEEAFQVECDYKGFRNHQAQHNMISTQLRFLVVRLEASSYDEADVEAFYQFLNNWIQEHILTEDVLFSHAYRAYREMQT